MAHSSGPCLECGELRVRARGLCATCYERRRRSGAEMPPKQRFSFEEHLAMVTPDENGCWPWPGPVHHVTGYGQTDKHSRAHVRSYEHHVGPVPGGHDVGHRCHDDDLSCQDWRVCQHRRCVNPAHLVAQTRSENLLSRPHMKSRCIRNHELIPANYRVTAVGSRQCLRCIEERRDETSRPETGATEKTGRGTL